MLGFSRVVKDRHGTAALEFALVAPLFFLTIFTLIGYGIYLSANYAVQQIAADAARMAVAGLSQTERQTLANNYINTSISSYNFIKKDKMKIDVKDDVNDASQFTVSLAYDSSDLPIWNLFSFALPDKNIKKFATIRLGGM